MAEAIGYTGIEALSNDKRVLSFIGSLFDGILGRGAPERENDLTRRGNRCDTWK